MRTKLFTTQATAGKKEYDWLDDWIGVVGVWINGKEAKYTVGVRGKTKNKFSIVLEEAPKEGDEMKAQVILKDS